MRDRATRAIGGEPPRVARSAFVLTMLVAVLAALVAPSIASAHTHFESATPGEGDVISEPVDVVTIVFTAEASPTGDEFVALTPDGVVQAASGFETADDKTFTVRFDPPLAGGQVGIRWNVQSADSHPIAGAFVFTVDAPAPTTAPPSTQAPATTVAPATTAPPADVAIDAEVTADDGTADDTDEATAASPSVVDADPPPDDVDPVPSDVSDVTAAAAPALSLDDFLDVDDSVPGETTASVGRVIGFLGVTIGLGALAFVATALRGRRDEIRRVLLAVRVLGVVLVVGAAIEYVGVSRIGAESIASGWSTSPGFATVLRIVGGIGLAVGVAGPNTSARTARPSVARSLSSAVIDDMPNVSAGVGDEPMARWTPDARSWPALAGAVLIVASFWFDGHTVSKGFRPLHALVNSVHVGAGAVWVGGVVTMAAVVWARRRSAQPMRVTELVVRFSKIATIALGAVVVAGGVMAFLVLDSFGELTGTPWGKILLLKSGATILAMAGGAYNHFRLLPALEADPDAPGLIGELRSTLTAEAMMLVFVATVTAWLVSAAS